jgi:hypothetical protein
MGSGGDWSACESCFSIILAFQERRKKSQETTESDPFSILFPAFALAFTRLDDPQSTQLSNLLSTTFRFRLPEIQDQAHHAASITSHAQAGLGGGAGDFREGMEGEERERQSTPSFLLVTLWSELGKPEEDAA